MKHLCPVLFALLGVLTLPAEDPTFPQVRITAGVEASRGESSWDMNFLFEEEPFGVMSGRSLLEWKDLEATTVWIGLDFALNPAWGVSARFGWGEIRGGNNTDTDWIGEEPDGTADIPISQSVADTEGDLRSGRVEIWYRFLDRPARHVDLVAGIQWHQENLRDRNGIQTFDLLDGPLYEPIEGLNSTFDFDWRGLRIGFRGENELRPNVRFCWQAVALVAVRYQGEGYWNLRDDFRAEFPQFEQRGDGGLGADLYAGLRWTFLSNWALEGGVHWLYLQIEDGREITYFSDGTVAETRIEEAETTRAGLSLALSYSF